MAAIRLYIDADVHGGLASVLRREGHDAVAAKELGHHEMPDSDLFRFAAHEQRAVLTFNTRHFVPLGKAALRRGERFWGVILSQHLPFRETHRRVLNLLSRHQQEDIRDSILWLNDYK